MRRKLFFPLLVCLMAWPVLYAPSQASAAVFSVGFGSGYHGHYGGYRGRHHGHYGHHDHYGRPRHGGHFWGGPWGWNGRPWIGLGMPLRPRRYYEQGSVTPLQPDIVVHNPPVPHSYREEGLGLDRMQAPYEQKAGQNDGQGGLGLAGTVGQSALPHADALQPVIYPLMTRESREAWERYQGWVRGGVPVPRMR